jgi:hypothetical protein
MQEKAELEKLINSEVLRWKDNPDAFFKELGLDPDEWAEGRIAKKVEDLQKSPEQLEKEKMMAELEELRKSLQKKEAEAEEARMQQLQHQASIRLEEEMTAALDKNPDLPRTRKTITRIADKMLWAQQNGFQDVSVEDVVPLVKQEIKAEFNEFIAELPDEFMEAYIGQKNLERLRKKRLAQMKNTPSVESSVKSVSKEPEKKEDPILRQKTIDAKSFFDELMKKY